MFAGNNLMIEFLLSYPNFLLIVDADAFGGGLCGSTLLVCEDTANIIFEVQCAMWMSCSNASKGNPLETRKYKGQFYQDRE